MKVTTNMFLKSNPRYASWTNNSIRRERGAYL
jgi:ribosomal protein L24E